MSDLGYKGKEENEIEHRGTIRGNGDHKDENFSYLESPKSRSSMPTMSNPFHKAPTAGSKQKTVEIRIDCVCKGHVGNKEAAILMVVDGAFVGIFKVTVQPHDQGHSARSISLYATGSEIWDGTPLAHLSHNPEFGNVAPAWLLHGSGLILLSVEGSITYRSTFDLTNPSFRSPNGSHQAQIWRPARDKSFVHLGL